MENLEPKKERSPIESLKFQRKSDYKKFRNFIKKETEELKGITEPKENKLKSILKVGGGLGFLAIGGLIGAKSRLGKDDGVTPKFGSFAIGRRNLPQSEYIPQRPATRLDPRARKFTRTTNKITTGANITRPTKALIPKLDEPELRGEKNIKARKITKTFADVEKSYVTKTVDGVDVNVPKDFNTQNITRTKKFKFLPNQITFEKQLAENIDTLSETIDTLTEADAARDALRDIKEGGKFGNITEDVSSRAKDVKAKKLAMQDAMRDFKIQSAQDDLLKKVFKQEKKFENTRPFKNIFSSKTYSKKDPQGRITSTISANPFQQKSKFARFTRRLLRRPNPKMTTDTFKGVSYKGKGMSLLGTVSSNPLVKAGFFILDAYAAYTSGKQVFNLKDNIGTALYDLYVSINNTINENDPDKLKYYISESSDKNMSIKQRRRNIRISEIKGKYYEKISGEGGNNIIVVPETKQNNEVKSTIPIKKGGEEVSFVPFEPVNSVGTDILLHKLNQ